MALVSWQASAGLASPGASGAAGRARQPNVLLRQGLAAGPVASGRRATGDRGRTALGEQLARAVGAMCCHREMTQGRQFVAKSSCHSHGPCELANIVGARARLARSVTIHLWTSLE